MMKRVTEQELQLVPTSKCPWCRMSCTGHERDLHAKLERLHIERYGVSSHVLAAAPDLLAALEACEPYVAMLNSHMFVREEQIATYAQLQAAIKKARFMMALERLEAEITIEDCHAWNNGELTQHLSDLLDQTDTDHIAIYHDCFPSDKCTSETFRVEILS